MSKFVTANQQWIKRNLDEQPRDDLYWSAVNRTFHQLTGLIAGYEGLEFTPNIRYEIHPVLLLNWNGDFYDLEKKLNKTRDLAYEQTGGKCSGLIKVAQNNSDLFISQVTMSGFQNMLRILKLYKFGYGWFFLAILQKDFRPCPLPWLCSFNGLLSWNALLI